MPKKNKPDEESTEKKKKNTTHQHLVIAANAAIKKSINFYKPDCLRQCSRNLATYTKNRHGFRKICGKGKKRLFKQTAICIFPLH